MRRMRLILGLAGTALVVGSIQFCLQAGSSIKSKVSREISLGVDHRRSVAKDRSDASPSRDKRVGDKLSTHDLLDRLTSCADPDRNFDREKFDTLLDELRQLDPNAAVRFVGSLPAGHVRDEALRRLAQGLASSSPDFAENWASQLTDEVERTSALSDICLQIAQTAAGEAVRMAAHYQLDAAPGTLMENLAEQWAGLDLPAATEWILSRPAGEQREQLCGRLAIVQAVTEPENAARLVLNEIPEGQNQTEAVIAVLYQWASRDMASATAWIELFPAGPVRERAESELSNFAAYKIQRDR